MQDITDLEQRILYALERIGRGLAALPGGAQVQAQGEAGGGSSIEVDVLRAELEAERSANAQLTERVRAIKDKQENLLAGLERKVAQLSHQLDLQGSELQRQRLMNISLTRANQKLGDAMRAGLSDPALLDEALRVELEAMRVARAAEMAEMEEIMAELKPLIGEVA
ncbi:MAG: hypothetical protein JSR87_02995 [Proteobacteria bacterium]|nr:hypothetical protein [Pseudomonadota bacterium]MBS0573673.1 hypothetical protein [Pseudomonadota bacterium]